MIMLVNKQVLTGFKFPSFQVSLLSIAFFMYVFVLVTNLKGTFDISHNYRCLELVKWHQPSFYCKLPAPWKSSHCQNFRLTPYPAYGLCPYSMLVSTKCSLLNSTCIEWHSDLVLTGNMVFGLGGTKALSLPMLTVLRRFSILMTMVGEWVMLDIRSGH